VLILTHYRSLNLKLGGKMIELVDNNKNPYTLKSGDKIVIDMQGQFLYFVKKTPCVGDNRLFTKKHKDKLSLPFSKNVNPLDIAFLFSILLGFNDAKLLEEDENMWRFELT